MESSGKARNGDLGAIPSNVREEAIAMGDVHTVGLLCKLFATYQPGNRQEKNLVLTNLEHPDGCTTALEAVDALRKWALWRRRAAAIGIAEPDASVLLQGLDKITAQVVKGDAELSFRVSLIRSNLQVDVCPTTTSITSFFQHLQAEMEQQARIGAAQRNPEATNPKLRAMTTSEATSSNAPYNQPTPKNTLCKFFTGEKGCRRGNTCKFPHTWSALEKSERSRRCLACGAIGHKVKDCKAPGGGAFKGGKKGEGKGDNRDDSSSTTSSPTRRVDFKEVPEVVMKMMKVLREVADSPYLRPLMAAVMGTKVGGGNESPRSKMALMDSGATHALRPPRDDNEWHRSENVNVLLAGDSATMMKQNSSGTLLCKEEVSQMIVPLGKVIDTLGYRLHWTPERCELHGEEGDVLPLRVRNGCPELEETTAQALIDLLEQKNLPGLEQATLESMRVLQSAEGTWWSYLLDYVTSAEVTVGREAVLRASFLKHKDFLMEEMILRQPKEGIWELMKKLKLNRRSRKRLMRAATWVIRWDPPGYERRADGLLQLGRLTDTVYVNLGAWFQHSDFREAWEVLLWGAMQGRVGAVLSKDLAATPTEFEAYERHRSQVHLLHALSTARHYFKGSMVPKFLVERRRFTTAEKPGIMWIDDGCAKAYLDEVGILDPMVQEDQSVEIVAGIMGIVRGDGTGRLRLAMLSTDAAWRLHVMRNHQPFRRDCAVCVRNAATGRRHKSTLHPSGYVLSVDVAGPLKGHGRSPDGKFFKYFVVGAFRIPKEDGPVHEAVRGHPIPPDLEDEEELSEDEVEEAPEEEESEMPTPEQVRKDQEEWKKLKASFKEPLETETLYFCVPVRNKKAASTLPAIQQMVVDIKALGYPIVRIHADRGGELRGNLVRHWVLSQGMLPTTSTGSEPAENGVAEAGVKYLKRKARILLDAARLGREHWPTAIQTAAVQQRCEKLGIMQPMVVAYGAKVYVKIKKYKTGDVEDLGPHWLQGKYLGPSTDVRGGHVILKSTGTFIQTTHVRVAREPPSLDEVAPTIVVEPEDKCEAPKVPEPVVVPEEPPLPPPPKGPPVSYAPPMYRTKGKTAGVELRMMQVHDKEFTTFANSMDDRDELQARISLQAPLSSMNPSVKTIRAADAEAVEKVSKELVEEGSYTAAACRIVLQAMDDFKGNLRAPRSTTGAGMILGAYVQGGAYGITMNGRCLPYTTYFLNHYMKKRIVETMPGTDPTWAALALHRLNEAPVHKDKHNQKGSMNYVMELDETPSAGLWVEGDVESHPHRGGGEVIPHLHERPDGGTELERIVDIKNRPVEFSPRSKHAYVRDEGPRWVLSAYTPAGISRLARPDVAYLKHCGFPVDGMGLLDGGLDELCFVKQIGLARETTPVLEASSSSPECVSWSRAQEAGDVQEDVEAMCDGAEYVGEWEVYMWANGKCMRMMRETSMTLSTGNRRSTGCFLWEALKNLEGSFHTSSEYMEDMWIRRWTTWRCRMLWPRIWRNGLLGKRSRDWQSWSPSTRRTSRSLLQA